MIEAGDSIAVAVSGGEDSGALLYILHLFRHHAPFTFNLQAVFVDLGWPIEPAPLACYAEQLGIPFTIEKTLIARIVFERRSGEESLRPSAPRCGMGHFTRPP